jgi:hypothetical protein
VSEGRQRLTRADLPEEFTPETIRQLPMSTLRRLARPGNGILTPEEQTTYDAVLHEVMSQTASRVSRQIDRPDWADVRRQANARHGRQGRGAPQSRVDQQLSRLSQSIDEQVGAAEALAPGVDWSFVQPAPAPPSSATPPTDTGDSDAETVSDLEQRLTEQVELVQVMSEIADVSKRTYALEQQRDLQSTRTVFFGFVVSVAVLVAGWAPIVAADDWSERFWILTLTLGTCALAGVVYGLIRKRQNSRQPDPEDQEQPA